MQLRHRHIKSSEGLPELLEAIAMLAAPKEVQAFLEDLCTPTEISSMAERWRVARLLGEGMTFRDISQQTGASSTTITRVARALREGTGYQLILTKRRRRRR